MTQPAPLHHLYFTFFGLLALTITTVAVSFVDLGYWNVVVALLIAFAKASLVVMIFMDVHRSGSLIRLFVLAGLLWFTILLLFVFSDYATRLWTTQPQSWERDTKLEKP